KLIVLGRVVVVLAIEDLEAKVQRAVVNIGLIESKAHVSGNAADVGLQGQGFAHAEEVIRLVIQTQEGTAQAAHAAVQADGVLAFLGDCRLHKNKTVLRVLMGFGILIHLQRIEVVQVIEPHDAQVPQLAVVNLAFLQRQFAADHIVARNGVALELNPGNVELFAFIDIDVEADRLVGIIEVRDRSSHEIDVSEGPVCFLEILQPFAELRGVEIVSILLRKLGTQRLDIGHGFVAGEGNARQTIPAALINGHGDVNALALLGAEGEKRQTRLIPQMRLRISHAGANIAAVAVGLADALGIFFQLAGVVDAGEKVLEENRVRNSDGPQVAHGFAQHARLHMLVAGEANLAHHDLGAFLHVKINFDGSRRNLLDIGLDGGKLVSVLAEHLLQHINGAGDAGGIVLALLGDADLFLFEAVQHVGNRDRVQTLIVNLANGRFFRHVHIQDDSLGGFLLVDADVFEI